MAAAAGKVWEPGQEVRLEPQRSLIRSLRPEDVTEETNSWLSNRKVGFALTAPSILVRACNRVTNL